jgi:ActR/RegA family two-component response regulator
MRGTLTATTPTALLIVDDEHTVCRALSRMLCGRFDEIVTALTPAEAELVLRSGRVTHLLCDHWFGKGQPVGLELVGGWRSRFPSLRRAVILTGTGAVEEGRPDGVDAVVPKTIEAGPLLEVLLPDANVSPTIR